MQKTIKSIGIIAIAAVIGLMTACGDGGGGFGKVTIKNTNGSLTITGLDAHNSQYVYGDGMTGDFNHMLTAANSLSAETTTGGMVSSNQVTLKVWDVIFDFETLSVTFDNFAENGAAEFDVTIVSKSTITSDDQDLIDDYLWRSGTKPSFLVGTGTVTVTFVTGKGTGVFVPSP